MPAPFHLAIPVHDLDAARAFYGGLLGCPEGRSSDTWVDFDLYGHQLVCHLDASLGPAGAGASRRSTVDGHGVPVPHFGVVLDMAGWERLEARLRQAEVSFLLEPQVRFRGQPGEQATLFFVDPSGNALEFKGFQDVGRQLFETAGPSA